MNYSEIKYCDIANGAGVRTSLFVSGCRRHCDGCFNSKAWDFDSGKPYTDEVEDAIIKSLKSPYVDGLSILGGEPLEPENVGMVGILACRVKRELQGKSVWLWSGDTYENVKDLTIMRYIDVLVDGPFMEEKKDITLRFRGSSNQRVIDVVRSRDEGRVVMWSDGPIMSSRKWDIL